MPLIHRGGRWHAPPPTPSGRSEDIREHQGPHQRRRVMLRRGGGGVLVELVRICPEVKTRLDSAVRQTTRRHTGEHVPARRRHPQSPTRDTTWHNPPPNPNLTRGAPFHLPRGGSSARLHLGLEKNPV